ncbi:DUF1697 domain-containing protein [Carboxylicivirga sp. M1479]|uniref:DUF1697 domain-containing protein n=1 Tax=Carboxylicivirga sp. M1479 TaxID=2594476 RepID=UPI001177597E|nr:DUF1697 domain-containing protein [Carboxylicivirga sp. M1479]TRX62378.1 DUF1697 domain-containing protein [Carboxylicivirga sp. M1479]
MIQYVALLRGINVGGKRKLLMKDLKQLFIKLGFRNIITYIQSGNVIFEYKATSNSTLETSISEAISEQFDYDVPVIVRNKKEWNGLTQSNPFIREDINKLHLILLQDSPPQESISMLNKMKSPNDQFVIGNQHIYLLCHGPFHKTKFTNTSIEKHLKLSATTRNWKTISKINGLMSK